jgi:hypothetical protein
MDQGNDLAILQLYGNLNLITAFSRKEKAFFLQYIMSLLKLKLKGSISNILKLSDPYHTC